MYQSLITSSLVFLCWSSPFLGLGIFFPLGILTLYKNNYRLRGAAFQSLILQIFINVLFYPFEFLSTYSQEIETGIIEVINFANPFIKGGMGVLAFLLLIMERYSLLSKFRKHTQISLEYFNQYKKKNKLTGRVYLILVLFFAILFTEALGNLNDEYKNTQFPLMILHDSVLYFWIFIFSFATSKGNRFVFFFLRRAFASFTIHTKLSSPTKDFMSKRFALKTKITRFREYILPGWGYIYLGRYWLGFPILFIYLLLFMFFVISICFYIDPIFGFRYMSSIGLKPGIPDKEFIAYTDYIIYPVIFFLLMMIVYSFSNYRLREYFYRDDEKDRSLRSGFLNNLQLSILAHLIFFSIIFIIPITVQRSNNQQKQNISNNHFQPEKMEFYFIDPSIPDEIKDLNGGVISGTETPSDEEGMKIPDQEQTDEGKVKGYVKRIKGKKLPKTYSNYISARMRGPESFMEYWKRAPYPYSCVVAYTITLDGDIIDIEIVEASTYPEQDRLTLELIESMSPVMPPPGVKGDVRVTELFWNGSIDPDSMPTQLQKEMVLMFDGRYMEEF